MGDEQINEQVDGQTDEPGFDSVDSDHEEGMLEDVRVLIVDDEKDVLDAITMAFQSEGALTLTAMDGDEAVKICEEDPPDLGHDVAKAIRVLSA